MINPHRGWRLKTNWPTLIRLSWGTYVHQTLALSFHSQIFLKLGFTERTMGFMFGVPPHPTIANEGAFHEDPILPKKLKSPSLIFIQIPVRQQKNQKVCSIKNTHTYTNHIFVRLCGKMAPTNCSIKTRTQIQYKPHICEALWINDINKKFRKKTSTGPSNQWPVEQFTPGPWSPWTNLNWPSETAFKAAIVQAKPARLRGAKLWPKRRPGWGKGVRWAIKIIKSQGFHHHWNNGFLPQFRWLKPLGFSNCLLIFFHPLFQWPLESHKNHGPF